MRIHYEFFFSYTYSLWISFLLREFILITLSFFVDSQWIHYLLYWWHNFRTQSLRFNFLFRILFIRIFPRKHYKLRELTILFAISACIFSLCREFRINSLSVSWIWQYWEITLNLLRDITLNSLSSEFSTDLSWFS